MLVFIGPNYVQNLGSLHGTVGSAQVLQKFIGLLKKFFGHLNVHNLCSTRPIFAKLCSHPQSIVPLQSKKNLIAKGAVLQISIFHRLKQCAQLRALGHFLAKSLKNSFSLIQQSKESLRALFCSVFFALSKNATCNDSAAHEHIEKSKFRKFQQSPLLKEYCWSHNLFIF